MFQAFFGQVNKPMPNQPNIVGEFYVTPEAYICCLCQRTAELVLVGDVRGLRCNTSSCEQRGYIYDPVRVWLPRARKTPAAPVE